MAGKDRIPSRPASKVKMVKTGKTKSLQQKLDLFQVVERPVTDTSSEPGDFHGQNHDHDHLDQPDLEAVIINDGMAWADTPETQIHSQSQSQNLSRSYADVASLKLTNLTNIGPRKSSGLDTVARPSTMSSLPSGSESVQGHIGPSHNSETLTFRVHSLQHKAEVAPIFFGI